MSSWAEERRRDRAAAREQDRLDADAEADRRWRDRDDREGKRNKRRDRRRAAWTAATAWVAEHAAELLVYPLALVSAAMAVPAMADYGHKIYGDATGYALPVISELGMWAFAFAVAICRRRFPDRPTAMLTTGIVVFAAVGAGLNFVHGLDEGLANAVVMAVVSVAGVVAHQLVAAGPRLSRAERAERRLARLAERRAGRARRIATRRAVVELDADGAARLVYAPGRYTPARRRLARAAGHGLPAASRDGWDAGLWGAAPLPAHGGAGELPALARAAAELAAEPSRLPVHGAEPASLTGSEPSREPALPRAALPSRAGSWLRRGSVPASSRDVDTVRAEPVAAVRHGSEPAELPPGRLPEPSGGAEPSREPDAAEPSSAVLPVPAVRFLPPPPALDPGHGEPGGTGRRGAAASRAAEPGARSEPEPSRLGAEPSKRAAVRALVAARLGAGAEPSGELREELVRELADAVAPLHEATLRRYVREELAALADAAREPVGVAG